MEPFQLSVGSGPFAARQIAQGMHGFLAEQDIDDDTRSSVELVVAEVVNNIVEHAYPAASAQGPIHLDILCDDAQLSFCIRDEGAAMPGLQAPEGAAQDLDVHIADLPEGGFGWFLIRSLACDVEYSRNGWENRLTFYMPICGADPA